MLTFSTLCDTKMFKPNGGVNIPIERFTVKMMPNCSGLIPSETAVPSNIGAKIRMAALLSKKHPTINNTIFKMSRKPIFPTPENIPWIRSGSWAIVAA